MKNETTTTNTETLSARIQELDARYGLRRLMGEKIVGEFTVTSPQARAEVELMREMLESGDLDHLKTICGAIGERSALALASLSGKFTSSLNRCGDFRVIGNVDDRTDGTFGAFLTIAPLHSYHLDPCDEVILGEDCFDGLDGVAARNPDYAQVCHYIESNYPPTGVGLEDLIDCD